MDYYLRVNFGDREIPVNVGNLRELTIVQDMHKFLPEFRMKIVDATGTYTHVYPFDKNMSKVSIDFAQNLETEKPNSIMFDIYQREPDSDQSTPSNIYDIEGLMSIDGLISPDYSRGFSGTIASTLGTIASELGVDSTDISVSLNYLKSLVQPRWSNIQFLRYLKERLIGLNDVHTFKCFIKSYIGKSTFVFKSIDEFITDQVSYKFVLADKPFEDRLPIYNYYICDNYKIYTIFASKKQDYAYYDYTNSRYASASDSIQNYLSLSDYFLVDSSDPEDSNFLTNLGRSNDFTSDFKGQVKSSFGHRIYDFVKMWITVQGLPNICPGQTIDVFSPYGVSAGNLYTYQYSGYWLVERVAHNFGDTFLTKLLLTRNGIDTDQETTLLRATNKKTR